MISYPRLLKQTLSLILVGAAIFAYSTIALAISTDSTSVPLVTLQGKQRYLSLTPSAAPSVRNNQSFSGPGYGTPQSITCSGQNNIMTGMTETNNTPTVPGGASAGRAYQSGNYRFDPYCKSASSILGTCTGFGYAQQYNTLDMLTVTCSTTNKLPYVSFDINNPSSNGLVVPSNAMGRI